MDFTLKSSKRLFEAALTFAAFCLLVPSLPSLAANGPIKLVPRPTTIAGTMNPLVVSLDGKPFIRSAKSVTGFALRGEKVKDDGDRARSFSTQVTGDVLKLLFYDEQNALRPLPDVVLPRIEAVQNVQGWMVFTISGKVTEVYFNNQKVLFQQGRAYWQIPKDPNWVNNRHTIEIKGPPGSADRAYYLQPSNFEVPPTVVPVGPSKKDHWFGYFQIVGIGALQNLQQFTISSEVSWNPTFDLGSSFQLKGNFGVSVFSTPAADRFFVAEYELLVSLALGESYRFEAGGGLQTWFTYGGNFPIASGNFVRTIEHPLFGIVDRFIIGYSAYLTTPMTHEAKLGIGIKF